MRILKQCLCCGADFLVQPSEIPKRHTCSKKCKGARESGNKKKYPREYQAYHAAKHRCTNKNSTSWSNYGGRGIKFDLKSFDEFIEHLGPCPEGWTIEREDNDGDYAIGNIKWATRADQNRNKRPSIYRVDKLLKQLRSSPQ